MKKPKPKKPRSLSTPAFVSTKRMPTRFCLTDQLRTRRVLRFVAKHQPTRSQRGRLAHLECSLAEAIGIV